MNVKVTLKDFKSPLLIRPANPHLQYALCMETDKIQWVIYCVDLFLKKGRQIPLDQVLAWEELNESQSFQLLQEMQQGRNRS